MCSDQRNPIPPFGLRLPRSLDSGYDHHDGITKVDKLTIHGFSERNTRVALNVNGQQSSTTTTADLEGRWSVQLPRFYQSKNLVIKAIAKDRAGNPSSLSDPLRLRVGEFLAGVVGAMHR